VERKGEENYSPAQFCLDCLIGKIQQETDSRVAHRLHLALISVVSSLPLAMLPGVLGEISQIIIKHNTNIPEEREKTEAIVNALYREIAEKAYGMEKKFMIQWWGKEAPFLEAKLRGHSIAAVRGRL
jgi:hypothetical protein